MPLTRQDDDFPKSVPGIDGDDSHDSAHANQRQKQEQEQNRQRSQSTSSTSSITSLFESSLALLGSLPVATSSSSIDKPILFDSERYGQFKLYLNSAVDTYDEIQLQSHLLWPSSPKLAQLMEEGEEAHAVESRIGIRGESVLELGAGSALLSLLAARMGASQIEVTDYPQPGIMDAIRKNVKANLNEEEQSRVSISSLDWTDEVALQAMSARHPRGFTRILAADTLWMAHLNASQLKVMTSLLSPAAHSKIIIVAGLHTGRHVIRSFLDMALEAGLEIERAEELDRREEGELGIDWKAIVLRGGGGGGCEVHEGIEAERRRWLAFIVLRWRSEKDGG